MRLGRSSRFASFCKIIEDLGASPSIVFSEPQCADTSLQILCVVQNYITYIYIYLFIYHQIIKCYSNATYILGPFVWMCAASLVCEGAA
jgi:hypothetical protein